MSANAVTSGDTVRVAPATNRIKSLPCADSTRVLPHHPRPTMAALIMTNLLQLSARYSKLNRPQKGTKFRGRYQRRNALRSGATAVRICRDVLVLPGP